VAANLDGSATKGPAESKEARRSVLIVDDEPGTVDALRGILEDDGYETCEARNGDEALRVYRSTQPDAVLLDLRMPVMDGLTALGEIRGINPDAKVAILSAVCTKDAVKSAIQAGASDFILKPFDINQVRDAVEELLSA
jgi:two-component system, chemotaxis family, chemotaxis protein CheY